MKYYLYHSLYSHFIFLNASIFTYVNFKKVIKKKLKKQIAQILFLNIWRENDAVQAYNSAEFYLLPRIKNYNNLYRLIICKRYFISKIYAQPFEVDFFCLHLHPHQIDQIYSVNKEYQRVV